MPDHKTAVGNVQLVALSDGQGDRDPVVTFPSSKLEIWKSEYAELLDANGHLHPRYGTTVVYSSGKLIIVDTGYQTPPGGKLLDDMKAKGIDREAVDLVVMTHLHPDHVGWNLSDGKPTFPKARYLAPRADWEYWTKPEVLQNAAHVRDQVVPLEKLKLLDLMDADYQITPELTTVSTPGHTPGHQSIRIFSAGQRGFILGDVAHNPAQAQYPDWNPIFDIQPELSRATRHKVMAQLEEEGALVSGGHFPDPGFGRFVRRNGRRVWQGI